METEDNVIRDPQKLLNALEAIRKENDEYKRTIAELKNARVEEQLKAEQKWEELYERKLSERESKYQADIESISSNYKSIETQLLEAQNKVSNYEAKIDENNRKSIANKHYLALGGKAEYFDTVWNGVLKNSTAIDGENVVNINSKSEDGKPIAIEQWMNDYRSNGGGIFFDPKVNASGIGVSPGNGVNSSNSSNRATIISRAEASNQKFMMELKNKLGKDPLSAISSGEVIVQ